jgi:TolB-like protein
MHYLKRGINDMLTSRLEKDSTVIVVTVDGNQSDLKALLQRANADYAITGSVTIMGDSVSTDSQVIEGSALDVPVLSFNRTGDQQADLIKHINELAATINTRILGRSQAPSDPAVTSSPAISQPGASAPPVPPVSTAQTAPVDRQPASASEPSRLPGISPIKGQASGITAGDVDGDGIADMVMITTNHLFVHRFTGGRWAKLAEYDSLGNFIGVDVADINENGKQEIFVTRFSQNETRVQSFVLEWDGKTLQRIATQMPWYFRRVDFFQRGQILVGQRQTQGKRFSSGIYDVKWTGDAYKLGERLALPRNLNVFGMAYGTVRIPDRPEVVTYNSDGYVEFQSLSGEETWVSAEHYGGGSNAIVFTDETQWDVQDYIFLSPRIYLHDMDSDGIQELLVVNNQKNFKASSVLDRHRFYAKGRLEWLKWQGEGIRSIVQTLDMAKFIADFALVDVDGDGGLDIVAAVVQKTRGMISEGSSYLVSFKIRSPQ